MKRRKQREGSLRAATWRALGLIVILIFAATAALASTPNTAVFNMWQLIIHHNTVPISSDSPTLNMIKEQITDISNRVVEPLAVLIGGLYLGFHAPTRSLNKDVYMAALKLSVGIRLGEAAILWINQLSYDYWLSTHEQTPFNGWRDTTHLLTPTYLRQESIPLLVLVLACLTGTLITRTIRMRGVQPTLPDQAPVSA